MTEPTIQKKLIYLASPYTTDDLTLLERRVQTIQGITAELVDIFGDEVIFFSPVAYTHLIDKECNTEPNWYNIDLEFLKRCDYMIIVKIKGWENSKGIQLEIDACEEFGIPFIYAAYDVASRVKDLLNI